MKKRSVPVVLLVALVALVALLLQSAPAGASFSPTPPSGRHKLRSSSTEVVLSDTGPGQSVTGFIADPGSSFDPVKEGYPTTDPGPGSGFSRQDEGFAGVIFATPPGGGADLSLYCIDIRTDTWVGVGYGFGTWDAANVLNVGYVARLLNEYYPNTPEPSLPNLNQTAAAVQAAIWFFSDRYVLSMSDSLHNTVAAIVSKVITEGPLVQPPPPTLTLTPPNVNGTVGGVLGAFKVTTNAAHATVTVTGGSMFSNAAGTAPIASGATVPSGQEIWVRSTGPSTVVLKATSEATVPSGNVYLYDGNWEGVNDAQRLILAETATLSTTVRATATFTKATPQLSSLASGLVKRDARGKRRAQRYGLLRRTGLSDTATLSGSSNATGTITFKLYGPDQATCAGSPVFTWTATAVGDGNYLSGSYTPTAAGTYRWVVDYSGDQNNQAAGPTACGEQSETVDVLRSETSLTSSASGAQGGARLTEPIHDQALLDRGIEPTGEIRFALYGPDDATCSRDPVFTSTAPPVSGNGFYDSEQFTPTAVGTYRWVATYTGDANNNPAGTACGDPAETVVISPAQPTIRTLSSNGVLVGESISDQAFLSGGADPTGTITFLLYGPDDTTCSGAAVFHSVVPVHGNGTYDSGPFFPTVDGLYHWVAVYDPGDPNNATAATRCNDVGEQVGVEPAPPPAQPDLGSTASTIRNFMCCTSFSCAVLLLPGSA